MKNIIKKRSLKILIATLLIFIMFTPYFESVASTFYYYKEKTLGAKGDIKTIRSAIFDGGAEKTGTVPSDNTIYDQSQYYRYITSVTGITPPSGASTGEIFIRELKGDSSTDQYASFYCLDPTRAFPPSASGTSYTSVGLLSDFSDQDLSSLLNSSVTVEELTNLLEKFYYKESFDRDCNYAYFEKEYKDSLINSIADPYNSTDKIYQFLTDDDIKVAQQWALWKVASQADWGYSPIIKRDLTGNGDDDTPPREGGYKFDRNAMLINLANGYNTSSEGVLINNTTLLSDEDYVNFEDGGENYTDFGTFRINTAFPDLMQNIELYDENGTNITNSPNCQVVMGSNAAMGTNFVIPLSGPINNYVNSLDLLNRDFIIRIKNPTETQSVRIEIEYIYKREIDAEIFTVDGNDYQNVIKIEPNIKCGSLNEEITREPDEIEEGEADLALRKFITHINNSEVDSRAPNVTQINEAIAKSPETTAHYAHIKQPLIVNYGDTIRYQINVYNESIVDGNFLSIADVLPKGLSLKSGAGINEGWSVAGIYPDGRTLIEYYADGYIKIPAASPENGGYLMQYAEITVDIEVDLDAPAGIELTNIAFLNVQLENDIDSLDGSVSKDNTYDILSITNDELPDYRGFGNNSVTLDQPGHYYRGYEDDDDFEKVIIEPVDLALRKFITYINNSEVDSREPNVTQINEAIAKSPETTAHYAHIKQPLIVNYGDTISYQINVYNESTKDAHFSSVIDVLPKGLSLKSGAGINENWNVVNTYSDGRTVIEYSVSEPLKIPGAELIAGNYLMQYAEITVDIEVDLDAPAGIVLTNIAFLNVQLEDDIDSLAGSISKDNTHDILSITNDELPNYKGFGNDSVTLDQSEHYYRGYEDDDDFEKVIIKPFDLALRKFITNINSDEVDNREPVVDVTPLIDGNDTTAIYTHPKNPVIVELGDVVTYKIRVYNEGGLDGYVTQIKDHLPKGLGFIVNHRTNLNQGWEQVGTKLQLTEEEKSDMLFLGQVDLNNIAKETSPGVYSDTENATSAVEIDIVQGEVQIITEVLNNQIIPAFNSGLGEEGLEFVEVEIAAIVLEEIDGLNLKNWAEISAFTNSEGEVVLDRDSIPDNWAQHPTGPNYEDDEDFENLSTVYFDLALRKFITNINDDGDPTTSGDSVDREPEVNITPLIDETDATTAIYSHPKTPVIVQKGDLVTYTIRVYNEGMIDGYVTEIKDHIPKGLAYLPQHKKNTSNLWQVESSTGISASVSDYPGIDFKLREEDLDGVTNLDDTSLTINSPIVLTKLRENDLINKFEPESGVTGLSFVDVQIVLAVLEDREFDVNENYTGNLKNWAEISAFTNGEGDLVLDRDSTPDNWDKHPDGPNYEDDEDFEDLGTVSMVFDLALQKFITGISSTASVRNKSSSDLIDRKPIINIDSNNQITYTKEDTTPPLVGLNDIVTYTIRVYNEGMIDGYAKKVRDTLPEGLTYLPNNEINTKYNWYYIDENNNKVENIEDATYIETDYLSRDKAIIRESNDETPNIENTIIEAFNKATKTVSYRDVQIVFRVNDKAKPGANNLKNIAEISDDEDENGNEVEDIDSTPGNNVPTEDDIDEENLDVTYFDLALLKIVTNVELTEKNVTKNIPTGHTFDMIPEPVVKTDLDERYLDTAQIKYTYKIRVFNEGLVEGYATKVADYIPQGLEFHETDQINNKWSIMPNTKGVVETTDLADVLLKPGEYATVELVLRWINDKNNMGIKTNVAEIYEDYNEHELDDIDSTPGNRVPGEDDIDDASVLVAIRTGAAKTFFIVSLTMAIIVALGMILIKRYIV